MSASAAPATLAGAPRIEPWHERLLRNGGITNERIFMQAEIDELRAALVIQAATVQSSKAPVATPPSDVNHDAPPRKAQRYDVPISIALWDTEAIAIYLCRSVNRVRSDIVCLPTFPRPIRLPGHGKSQALYKAREVVAWAESYGS